MTTSATGGVRHLYVHVPFCAHRCGYCDFVTAVGQRAEHPRYVDALLSELEMRREMLDSKLETVYVGGGTPTYLEPASLRRLLAALPSAAETTVEANPETVTPALAELLVDSGVERVSLGAQSFDEGLLVVLERGAGPDDVRRSVAVLREAGIENLSLDLIYGIPGQTRGQLARDLEGLVELAPEHISAYELEAKPGTRFTHAHGAALVQQREELEEYMQLVTETLQAEGYRWYETASFTCERGAADRRSKHNLAYWLGRDYVGIGVGAVSTVGSERWQNSAGIRRYMAALQAGSPPPGRREHLGVELRAWERAMLGLRLDEGIPESSADRVIDADGLERLLQRGLVTRERGRIRLTESGRPLGDAVTAELLVDSAELAPLPGAALQAS